MTPKPLAKHQVVKLAVQTCKACAMENQNCYNRMKKNIYTCFSLGVFGASWNAGFGLSSSSTPLWCWRLRPCCPDVLKPTKPGLKLYNYTSGFCFFGQHHVFGCMMILCIGLQWNGICHETSCSGDCIHAIFHAQHLKR